ncbi:PspC domain-containing protein [Actinokineospora xionganensis]|uniref:PspC domain-containing protein n=1 Tax=Actinokineospora xionganensis TaxID=2684470 RepID=UPI0028ADD49E|nr:PspC domain-containing protein [Actinokineospora xionganensis]
MSGESTKAHSAPSVEDTLKDFWATRPRRPRQGRKVAGVAAGIGARYGIDPVIVRVAFVVATFFGGAGVLAYLLGWLFLAEEDDEASPIEALAGHGSSSSSTAFTVALCVAMLPAFWWFFDRDFSGFLAVALIGGSLFLLHRHRSHLGVARPPAAARTSETETGPTVVWDPIDPGYEAQQQRPPAWDPLGAAPFAWDLPEPSSREPDPEPPAPRRRSKVGLVTMAFVLLAVGVGVLVGPDTGGWLTFQHGIGVILGILGLGLVAGAFSGGGRGLIGLAVPLAAVGIAMTVVWPTGITAEGVGDVDDKPLTIEQVRSSYQRNLGSVTLDLRELPTSGEVKTKAKVDVGDVTVIVPETADVTVKCSAGVGSVKCLNDERNGPDSKVTTVDLGPDGKGGLVIELDAIVSGPGSVEVRRG